MFVSTGFAAIYIYYQKITCLLLLLFQWLCGCVECVRFCSIISTSLYDKNCSTISTQFGWISFPIIIFSFAFISTFLIAAISFIHTHLIFISNIFVAFLLMSLRSIENDVHKETQAHTHTCSMISWVFCLCFRRSIPRYNVQTVHNLIWSALIQRQNCFICIKISYIYFHVVYIYICVWVWVGCRMEREEGAMLDVIVSCVWKKTIIYACRNYVAIHIHTFIYLRAQIRNTARHTHIHKLTQSHAQGHWKNKKIYRK